MVLKQIQRFKERHGIGFSGSRAKKKREDSERKVNTSRPRKNRRGRTTGKEYWNPMTGKHQSTPVKAPVTKDHLGRDPEVGAKKRKSVRQNPVSDETLKTVKTTLAKEKAEKAKKVQIKGDKAKKAKEAGAREREENEWGPGGQPSASKQFEIQAKNKEADERAKWEKKTRNSPARRSGAFSKDELWEQQKKHRKFKADRKEGKLKREKFNPRAPRGTQRKLVQKTPAEIAAERRKKEVNAAKNNKSTNKISPSVPVEKKKKKPGFDAERSGSSI